MSFFYAAFEVATNLFNKRGHAQAMKVCFREAMEWIQEMVWAEKFTVAGFSKYRMKARTRKWVARKIRQTGQHLPNVYRGNLVGAVLHESVIRATQTHGTMTAKGTFPMPQWQREEIESILPGQRRYLIREWLPRRYRELALRREFRDKLRQRIRS